VNDAVATIQILRGGDGGWAGGRRGRGSGDRGAFSGFSRGSPSTTHNLPSTM